MHDNDHDIGRRPAMKAIGATLGAITLGAGTVAGAPPNATAEVEIRSDKVMRTNAGTAIRVSAILPEGGYVAITHVDFQSNPEDPPKTLIGINRAALGRGKFPNMLIGIDPSLVERTLEGDEWLHAQLLKDPVNNKPDGNEVPYTNSEASHLKQVEF